MNTRTVLLGAAAAALTIAIVDAGQAPPAQTPPPQNPAPVEPAGRRGQGRGRAVFPAQQRAPGDPALIDRGRGLYAVTCSACHGVDLRGGQLGGPNLLRSQLMLNDQQGELLLPVIRGSRADKGMPPLPMSEDDVKAVAEFIHSVQAASRGQGSPPESDAPPPDPVVGNAAAGQAYFAAKCSTCHSATGDLQGLATKVPDPRALQNLWVSGGAGRGGRGRGAASPPPPVTVTVTLPSGDTIKGELVKLDDFLVTIRQADGMVRSVRRDDDNVPKVEVRDPLEGHRTLLGAYTDKDMHDVTAYLVTLK